MTGVTVRGISAAPCLPVIAGKIYNVSGHTTEVIGNNQIYRRRPAAVIGRGVELGEGR